MRTNPISLNPFSLMMEPELVLQAMERSTALRALQRRQLHPLDKPLIPYAGQGNADPSAGAPHPTHKAEPRH